MSSGQYKLNQENINVIELLRQIKYAEEGSTCEIGLNEEGDIYFFNKPKKASVMVFYISFWEIYKGRRL